MAKIIGLLLITAGTGMADNTIKMDVVARSKRLEPKRDPAIDVQERWLEIAVTAFHLEKASQVKLEWVFFSENLDSNIKSLVKQQEGAETIDLAQGKKANVTTKSVIFKFSPRHSVSTGKGLRAKSKIVEPSGLRYHGWGIRAYVDGELAGEVYSSAEIQKTMNPT